jgi:hypothetical protein
MGKPRKPGEQAIRKYLAAALTSDERDEILARLLGGLTHEVRERLLAGLPAETSEALAGVLSAGQGRAAAAGMRKLQVIWERFRARWDEVLAVTGDEDGPYVLRDPHWEPPWLDGSDVTEDLDQAAREVVEHMPGIVAAGIDGDLTPGEFLADSREEFGAGLPEWFGESEDQFCPGPVASELLCRWSLARSLRGGADGFRAASELLEFLDEAEVGLDEIGIRAALLALPEERQAELVKGLASPAGTEHFGRLLADPRTPWARVFDELASRHAPDVALARDREGIDREIAAVAGEPVDIERELVVSQLIGEHRDVEDEVLIRLFERAERAAAAEGRKARERAAVLQAAAVGGVWRWDELVRTFRSVPKQYLEVREALFASAKDAVAILCFPRDLVADPVARYTDALLDGLLAGAGGREDAVARLCNLIERAAAGDESFDRYQSPLAALALDIAGGNGPAGKGRLRELLVDVAGCQWEAVEIRNSRRAAVRVLGAETLLPRILSVIREHAGVLVPDPANAHKSDYGRQVRALAGIRELDARAAAEIVARWRVVHSRRRSLWEALRAEDIDGLE